MLADKLIFSNQSNQSLFNKLNKETKGVFCSCFSMLARIFISFFSSIVSWDSILKSLIFIIVLSLNSRRMGCLLVNEKTSTTLPLSEYWPGSLTKSTFLKFWSFKWFVKRYNLNLVLFLLLKKVCFLFLCLLFFQINPLGMLLNIFFLLFFLL